MAITDDILDDTLRHAHYLERYKSGVVNKIVGLLNNGNDKYYAQIYRSKLENLNRRDVDKLLVRLKKSIKQGYEPVIELLDGEIRDLGQAESIWQKKIIDGLVPIELDWEAPSEEQIYASVNSRPFQGLLLKDWYRGLEDGAFRRIKQNIMQGYVEGQTTDQIVRNIRDISEGQTRRAAETAVRTALAHTSNIARNESYRRNKSVIKAIEWVATLDNRTTAICRARDGKTYPFNKGPRPPAHAGCRSTTIPVLKSLRQLGIKADEVPVKSTRASMNGQVSSELNYDGWLRKQPREFQDDVLGVQKARLFRKGLTMERFVDKEGREFTLKELEQREKEIWAKVYGGDVKPKAKPRKPPSKPKIDVTSVMTVKGFTKDELNSKLNSGLTPLTARVADKLPKPNKIVGAPKKGVYYSGERKIESGLQKDTMTHEYGHHVDAMLQVNPETGRGTTITGFWSSQGLKEAWEKDRAALGVYRVSKEKKNKRLLEIKDELFNTTTVTKTMPSGATYETTQRNFNFDGANNISDIVDSFVKGDFRRNYNTFGHSKSYWKYAPNGRIEAFANLFAVQNRPEANAYAKKNFPNLYREFMKKLEDFDANS